MQLNWKSILLGGSTPPIATKIIRMKTTFELIEQYLLSIVNLTKVELVNYFINGSVIKIQYSYESPWINKRLYDNYTEVELLDYITFLFNIKNNNYENNI